MLQIQTDILHNLKKQVVSNKNELGFVLGSTLNYQYIDHAEMVPAIESGPYFYKPNDYLANLIIHRWAESNICFSGFIHSHPKGNQSFSRNDLEFAEQLLIRYHVPFLWFGLAVVNESLVDVLFYKIYHKETHVILEQTEYQSTE